MNDSQLRQAQRLAAEHARPREDCPDADALWAVAVGECTGEPATPVVDHIALCPTCAEAFRLARALEHGAEPPAAANGDGHGNGSGRWMAVGAGLLAAGLATLWMSSTTPTLPEPVDPGDEYRGGPSADPLAPLNADLLPRDAFTLRWRGGPPGTVFDVRIMNARLELLDQGFELARPEYTIPAASLASLPEGSVVLWTIIARLPDGRAVTSRTWRATIGTTDHEARP